MAEILDGIRAEEQATEGVSWKELRQPANRYRMLITVTIQIGRSLPMDISRSILTSHRCSIDGKHVSCVLYVSLVCKKRTG